MSIGSAGYDTQLDYVVKGVIPANSLCSTYGASGSYKSFLACSWACHVATGRHWGGRRVAHGSVMYVVGEGGIGVPAVSRHGKSLMMNGWKICTW